VSAELESEGRLREEKARALHDLAAGVGGELGDLLTALLGNVRLLENHLPPDASGAQVLRALEGACRSGLDLHTRLLTCIGQAPTERRRCDLSRTVEEVALLLGSTLPREVQLRVQAGAVPRVLADPAQIRRLLIHLLSNACEALGSKGGRIHLGLGQASVGAALRLFPPVQVLAPDEYVRIEVSDNGPGIDPSIRSRVCDPYFTTRLGARGLGLSLAVGIARQHHGGLNRDTRVGRGTTVSVYLPCSRPPTAADALTLLRDRTVLVVDAEPDILTLFQHLLAREGARVLSARSVQAGLAHLADPAAPIDLALLDLTAGGADVPAVYREIRRLRPHLPLVLMSGYGERDTADLPFREELAGFLPKPFRIEQALAVLRAACSGAQGL
jgi:two-component system cell cycle sensor histidine kinase/response regulator CckA